MLITAQGVTWGGALFRDYDTANLQDIRRTRTTNVLQLRVVFALEGCYTRDHELPELLC